MNQEERRILKAKMKQLGHRFKGMTKLERSEAFKNMTSKRDELDAFYKRIGRCP